ncbi:MAG: AAA family ATPase [Ignavibacteria bacterium]|jgi:energy-coupling factor transporter ATP-binding protein EcfA2|nr:AAA family ATPase [Ignavibacteria bacterium]MCU7522279.1 AAA family ATPase [Ignavibacteria bacterium]
MIKPSDIIDYISSEQAADNNEVELSEFLSNEAIEERGTGKFGLQIVEEKINKRNKEYYFECKDNESKFRPGDTVFIFNEHKKYEGKILESDFEQIVVSLSKKSNLDRNSKWSIKLQTQFLATGIINALKSLSPGAPGWSYFSAVTGNEGLQSKVIPTAESHKNLSALNSYLEKHGVGLDESQYNAIIKCLVMPRIHAVQGPPGTGKSTVLAIIAAILTSYGKRVAVLAPTHQAVNNALNTIYSFNPEIEIIKIGGELKNEGLNEGVKQEAFNKFDDEYSLRNRRRNPPIVGMTYHSAIFNLANRANSFAPNVLLIDEAGQLSLPLGSVAGSCGAGSVMLFGDDMQMPPIFSSDLIGHKFSVSIFRQLRRLEESLISKLEITYRMNSVLCNVTGNLFYKDTESGGSFLRSHPSKADQKFRLNISEKVEPIFRQILNSDDSLVWVNTSTTDDKQINKNEAAVCAELVDICLKSGLNKNDIAVITPYRKQAAEIRRRVLKNINADEIPIIDTVEKVQGASVEIIIISFVSSDPEYIFSMSNFLFSSNRINVSVSRAKTKAVILCPKEMLETDPSHYEALVAQDQLKEIKSFSKTFTYN